MNKIQKISCFFKWLFTAVFISLPILYGVFWAGAPSPFPSTMKDFGFSMSLIPGGIHIMHPLSIYTKTLGFVISLIPLSINLFILFFIVKLFKNFENKEIFSLSNVKIIKKVGLGILIGQFMHLIYDLLMSVTLTWHNPVGHRVALMTLKPIDLGLLFTSLLIILISWIMMEAYQLKEENQYII